MLFLIGDSKCRKDRFPLRGWNLVAVESSNYNMKAKPVFELSGIQKQLIQVHFESLF